MATKIALAEAYTLADPTEWKKVTGLPSQWRLQVDGDTNFDGNTVEVEIRDADGANSGAPITLEAGVTALSATSAQQYMLTLVNGDEIRLNPSAGGGAMSLTVYLVPIPDLTRP